LVRRLLQAVDHPDAKLRRREQIITTLSGCIQPGHRLIQVRTDPPH
jgi:hypothetical protein